MARSAFLSASLPRTFAGRLDCDETTLCIGDLLKDCNFPDTVRYARDVEVISWPQLAGRLSHGMSQGLVFSAALSVNFDCVDIAQLLHRAAFEGRYRIVAPEVPNTGLIRRELHAMCPGLDVDIGRNLPGALIRAS